MWKYKGSVNRKQKEINFVGGPNLSYFDFEPASQDGRDRVYHPDASFDGCIRPYTRSYFGESLAAMSILIFYLLRF